MNRRLYPRDWEAIAMGAKVLAGWRCQLCGKQCRRPGEPFDTHRRTLTVHHPDRDPWNPRAALQVLCAPCHLRDEARLRRTRA